MSETKQFPDNSKQGLFHENIIPKTEITGGIWNPKTNTYSIVDSDSGITTEYRLWKAYVETGLGGKIHTYKDMLDPKTGKLSKTEVVYDDAKGDWVKKNVLKRVAGDIPNLINTEFMATLSGAKSPDANSNKYSLVIEPAKWKKSNIDYAIPIKDAPFPVVIRSGNFNKSS